MRNHFLLRPVGKYHFCYIALDAVATFDVDRVGPRVNACRDRAPVNRTVRGSGLYRANREFDASLHRARRQATLAPALLVATYRNGSWRQ